ncbi:MAG: hypothetical protein GXO72_02420 [Caldiserica bacterium]|nr:hypothetical protein [Caldisericota bacterium]
MLRNSSSLRILVSLWLLLWLARPAIAPVPLGTVAEPQPPTVTAPPAVPGPESPGPKGIHGRVGIHLSFYALSRPGFAEAIASRLREAGFNAVVICVKDMHGTVGYDSRVPLAREIGAAVPYLELPDLIDFFREQGIYVIARQVLFYDPVLSAYLGYPEERWVYPSDGRAVEYNLAIARELEESGFDEIQFDYIRFPDDGEIGERYPERYAAVNAFLRRAREALSVPISIDLFGRVLWPWNREKKDPIGQCLEEMAPYVDVISPMLYPSHYVEPELKADPYRTVRLALEHGMARVEVPFRPYLQAFDMDIPPGMTLPEYILAQVRAAEEVGADGYLFWNPRSDYTSLWEALRISRGSGAAPRP